MTLGYVAFVNSYPAGSETNAFAAAGGSTLVVADGSDFNLGDGGGFLDIGEAGQPLAYTSAVLGADRVTATVTLKAALLSDVAAGVRVDVWTATDLVVEYRAGILLPGRSGPVEAVLPAQWAPLFPVGPRTGDDAEAVEVDETDNGWQVVRPLLQTPQIHGGFLRDSTVKGAAVDLDDVAETNWLADALGRTNLKNVSLSNATISVTSADGSTVEIDGLGGRFRVLDPDGVAIVEFGSSSVYLKGEVDANTISAVNAEVASLNIQPSGHFQLDSTLGPPTVGPIVNVTWPQVAVTGISPPVAVISPASILGYQGGSFYLARQLTRSNERLQMWSFSSSDGVATLVWDRALQAKALNPGSLAYFSGAWYLLVVVSDGVWAIQKRDPATGDLLAVYPVTRPVTGNSPAFGPNLAGSDLLVVWDNSTNFEIQHYSTAGALTSTKTTNTGGGVPRGIIGGTFDYGAMRYVTGYPIGPGDGLIAELWVFDDAATPHDQADWSSATNLSGGWMSSLAWDGSAFWEIGVVDGGLVLYALGGQDKTAGSQLIDTSVATTWRDATHETVIGTPTGVQRRPRAYLSVTVGSIPTQADRAALYVADTASPARTDYYLQGTPVFGEREWFKSSLTLSGTHPPAAGSFPTGLSDLRTADGTLQIKSDGTGHIFDLIAAAGGGSGTGGIDIDCGDFSATGVDIDCGGF